VAKIGPKSAILAKITRTETNGTALSATSASRGITKKDIREMVGRATDGGEDIVRFMVNVMQGRIPRVSPGAQVQAAEWLGAYFFGRPVETTVQVSMTKAADGTMTDISDEQLEALIRGETRPAARLDADRPDTRVLQGESSGGSVAHAGGPESDDAIVGDMGLQHVRGGVVAGDADASGDVPALPLGQPPPDVEEEPD
jgi:hypothetical protein